MDVLKQLPDKCIDAIISDVPYFVQAQGCGGGKNKWNNGSRFKGGNSVFGVENNQDKLFNYVHPKNYMPLFSKVIKGDGHVYIFSNDKNLKDIITEAENCNLKLMNILVVNKLQGTYFSYYQKYCEFILFFRSTKGKAKYINNCGQGNYFEFNFTRGKNKKHPSEKPVKLYEVLIKNSSQENDIVLDAFSGSGTAAIACRNLKRRFICIEKDYDYWKASVERLNIAQSQLKLF